jgi:hypothetical protein
MPSARHREPSLSLSRAPEPRPLALERAASRRIGGGMNVLLRFALGGFIGSLLENMMTGEVRRSALVPEGIPFLPIYGAGLVVVTELAPKIKERPIEARAAVYAATLTALELAACQIERADGRVSWAYDKGACVDVPHATMWGLLGLLAERL